MKTKTKALLITMCAALLVVATVFTTLAFLTDTKNVVNTFTVGNVHIKLDEAKVNSEDGIGDTALESGERTTTNKYHLLPGHQYDKDPTVTVLGTSEECYVRMFVSVNKKTEWQAIADKYAGVNGVSDIFVGKDDATWVPATTTASAGDDYNTFEFRYKTTVAKNAADSPLKALFTDIKMPTELTNEDLASLGEDFQICIYAEAIQADGFENEDEAFGALGTPGTDKLTAAASSLS